MKSLSYFGNVFKRNFVKNKSDGFIFITSPWAFKGYSSIEEDYNKKLAEYKGFWLSVSVFNLPEVTAYFRKRRVNITKLPAIIEYRNGRCIGVHQGLPQFNAFIKYGETINDNYKRHNSRDSDSTI